MSKLIFDFEKYYVGDFKIFDSSWSFDKKL